jgi:hypothetical protein
MTPLRHSKPPDQAGPQKLGESNLMSERIVVHRRQVRLERRTWTALSLRPSQPERFATNRFHDTWHVLSDVGGAHLLGRICWAMAYQRIEQTIFVIDRTHLVTNPFDADPSSPIIVINSDLGTPTHGERTALKRFLPWRQPSEGRVSLSAHGLDLLDSLDEFFKEQERTGERYVNERQRRWVDRADGLLTVAAPTPVLREWGALLTRLGERSHKGMDYTELDWPIQNGEVQVFDDFRARVSRALVARQRLFPGRDHEMLNDDERNAI